MNFCKYQHYIWVYVLGTALTLGNGLFLQNALLTHLSLALLYGILFYKGVYILLRYQKTANCHQPMDRGAFSKTYHRFRLRVVLFWLAFIALCFLGKFIFLVERIYFYSCTFFFLFLDRWFVNAVCLLQKFSDPKGLVVLCCCGCPCRGWDLMMIHTPLLFALQMQGGVENILILLSSLLAVLSLVCWEMQKYHLVELKPKCPTACDLKLCREHQ